MTIALFYVIYALLQAVFLRLSLESMKNSGFDKFLFLIVAAPFITFAILKSLYEQRKNF